MSARADEGDVARVAAQMTELLYSRYGGWLTLDAVESLLTSALEMSACAVRPVVESSAAAPEAEECEGCKQPLGEEDDGFCRRCEDSFAVAASEAHRPAPAVPSTPERCPTCRSNATKPQWAPFCSPFCQQNHRPVAAPARSSGAPTCTDGSGWLKGVDGHVQGLAPCPGDGPACGPTCGRGGT